MVTSYTSQRPSYPRICMSICVLLAPLVEVTHRSENDYWFNFDRSVFNVWADAATGIQLSAPQLRLSAVKFGLTVDTWGCVLYMPNTRKGNTSWCIWRWGVKRDVSILCSFQLESLPKIGSISKHTKQTEKNASSSQRHWFPFFHWRGALACINTQWRQSVCELTDESM